MIALERVFEETFAQIPVEPDACFTLNAENCALPPEEVVTDRLKVLPVSLRRNYHGDSSPYDLESPSGNWSVAIGSAEARLWVGYDYH
jgi:hypothetical protein